MEIKREVVLDVIRFAREQYSEELKWDEKRIVSLAEIDKEEVRKNPKRNQLLEYMEGLSPQEKAELVALMWIGRGDKSPESHPSALRGVRPYPTLSATFFRMPSY